MPRLSSKLSELESKYTVVVVGSGYGGGIAASRLARAGQRVCVLERGREFALGEFPDTELESVAQMQVTAPGLPTGRLGSALGLFDFHVEKEVTVLRGCGLGGTSLINANVALEADPRVFEDPRWPRALVDDMARIHEGTRRARAMLEPKLYPDDKPRLAKLEAHRHSAEVMGEPWARTPINVSFDDRTNPFGVSQPGCNLCGDCVSGCNVGAKNTVAMNYLPDAWNHGAQIFTEVAVHRVERRDDGLWAVHIDPVGAGREVFDPDREMVVLAELVILAAGTLGSTEILLRSRAHGLATSKRLGHGFSGNADVLAFGYNNDRRIDGVGAGTRKPDPKHPVGPTITSIIDGRTPGRPLAQQFVIEEGALPGGIDAIYPASLRGAAKRWGTDTDEGLLDALAEKERELVSRLPGGAYHGAVAHTQTYLAMGHDSAGGRLRLDDDERLRLDWPKAESEPVIAALNQKLLQATAANGGTFVPNPMWSNHFESDLITVHPLGGCPMAEDAAAGVTNHKGQVFAGEQGTAVHEGLYVADGSVIPTAVGVNPLLTISAVAERCMALIAEARGWSFDTDPRHRPAVAREPAPPPGIGVRFTERMAGHVAVCHDEQRSHDDAAKDGEIAGESLNFVLTLRTDDLDATLADPAKRMGFIGTVEAPTLSPRPLQVSQGRFSLLSEDPEHLDTTNMIYEMTLTADDGRRWHFRGVKYVHDDFGPDLWSDTTTLYVDLRDDSGALTGRGVLRISLSDFAKQVRTIATTGTQSRLEALQAQVRFGRFFMGSLFDTYGDVFARPAVFDPKAPPRKRRSLRTGPPQIHYFFTSDGEQLCLTRYRGGDKGPLLLVHGLGVSSGIFTVDTIDTNLVEYLFAHGYDLWLLDFRASIELGAASKPANADVMATIDLPEAVNEVRRLTGAASVQMLVHCFGSTVFFMSMLSGKLEGVRAAVASQATPHVDAAAGVRLKSGLHLPQVLDALGVETLTAYTDTDASWLDRLYDHALSLYPTELEERCRSATCHRISFMYSLLYEHDQLAIATHDTLHELFGVASVAAFDHLAKIVRAGQLVDADGRDVYMAHAERLAIPLRIIHGAENACFRPSGSEKTLAWLQAHNDPSLVSRVEIPNFGHIDCIFGERAATVVYPHILEHLERNL